MKGKRILATLLTLCVLVPLVPSAPANAEDGKYCYRVYVKRSTDSGSQGKKDAIKATLVFENGQESGTLDKAHEKGSDSVARTSRLIFNKSGTLNLYTDYEPWTMKEVIIKNTATNDPYKIESVEVVLWKGPGVTYPSYIPVIGMADVGKWISAGSDHPTEETVKLTEERGIRSMGNYDDFVRSFHFSSDSKTLLPADGNSSVKTSYQWDGLANHAYKEDNVSVLTAGSAPKFSVTTNGVDKNGNPLDSTKALCTKKIFTVDEKTAAFSFDQGKLIEYMNEKGANQISLQFCIEFPEWNTRVDEQWGFYRKFYRTMTFTRDVFTLNNLKLSDNYSNVLVDNTTSTSAEIIEAEKADNLFYNTNSKDMTITLTGQLKRSQSYSHLSKKFKNATMNFDEAYLTTSDGSVKIYAKNGSSEKLTSVTLSGNARSFSMQFPYENGLDTQNQGLKLVIKNGTVSDNNVVYDLWDDANKKKGLEALFSKYKLDSTKPSITVEAATDANGKAETDLNKWNKYLKVVTTASEGIFAKDGDKVYENRAVVKLMDGYSTLKIREYNYNPSTGLPSASVYSDIIAAAPGRSPLTTVIAPGENVGLEGEYDLVFEGYDRAGNAFSSKHKVRLDNLPPTVWVQEKAGKKNPGETLHYRYNFSISDFSGTGTLYYIFTKGTQADAEKLLNNEMTKVEEASGEFYTTEDKWAFIEQSDIENGKTSTAVMSVPDGQIFKGNIYYFAVDEAGNKSNVASRAITIDNRNTSCSILPKSGAIPQPSYQISILPQNTANTISYYWTDNRGRTITEKKKYQIGEVIDTSKVTETASLNGVYYLNVEVAPPENGSVSYLSEQYVFDNKGPEISFAMAQPTLYGAQQQISISATDDAGVASGTAKLVSADGQELENSSEFALNVKQDVHVLEHSTTIHELSSGSYALLVTATDLNGIVSTKLSSPFFIRNAEPTGTVSVASKAKPDLKYGDDTLVEKDGKLMLSFDIFEAFSGASQAKKQALYYRTSTVAGSYDDWWLKAGNMTTEENGFSCKTNIELSHIYLQEPSNLLYVQTAVLPDLGDFTNETVSCMKTNEMVIYYDETAPTAELEIVDVHQKAAISGTLSVKDNLEGGFTAKCSNPKVQIGEWNEETGSFPITVTDSLKETIVVSDAAGNETEVPVWIQGIDNTPPTATMTKQDKTVGARQDVTATIQLFDVSQNAIAVSDGEQKVDADLIDGEDYQGGESSGTAQNNSLRFALIPVGASVSDTIPEGYFRENLQMFQDSDDFRRFKLVQTHTESARWDNENNLTYQIDLGGFSGDWYIGVRAQDSLGNSKDIIFKDQPVHTQDASAELLSYSVSPKNAETRSVVTVNFNVPVYVLPQSSVITGTEDDEAANYELVKKYAMSYSDKTSFVITEGGNYPLYLMDEFGRTYMDENGDIAPIMLEIKEKVNDTDEYDVQFGVASGMKLKIEKIRVSYTDEEGEQEETLPEDAMIAANYVNKLVITPETATSGYNLLLPVESLGEYGVPENGFSFDEYSSEAYRDSAGNLIGYTKLVYSIDAITEFVTDENDENFCKTIYLDDTERFLKVTAFHSDSPSDATERELLITGIDNTPPVVNFTSNPVVITFNKVNHGGEVWNEPVYHPTPGNVTYTVTAQDKESGIDNIVLVRYVEKAKVEGEADKLVEISVPKGATEYHWEGYGVMAYLGGGAVATRAISLSEDGYGPIPVEIDYYGDDDPYGVKTLVYTFTDAIRFWDGRSNFAEFENTEGITARTEIEAEVEIHTEGIIYKMPIEENQDFSVEYQYEDANGNWIDIPKWELENTYYKKAKAIIDIPEGSRGEERGLFVVNNGGSLEKELTNNQNSFTFKLRDSFGYTADKTVELSNFDVIPGTVDYQLSTTANTNQDVIVTIAAQDAESGIGKVILGNGSTETELTAVATSTSPEGVEQAIYTKNISENGTYTVILYDKVGNKTLKSFHVKNIDTSEPTATVSYQSGDQSWTKPSDGKWTARPVIATLTFSKPNVNIVGVEPQGMLTNEEFSVNYRSSVITFTESGTLDVYFEDAYGNQGVESVTVLNIDKTPPLLEEPTIVPSANLESAIVSFKKKSQPTSQMDTQRKESEIYVSYGGVTKSLVTVEGDEEIRNSFVFSENGTYTFRVYDIYGLSSLMTVVVDKVDTTAPEITNISWTVDREVYDSALDKWVKKSDDYSITPSKGAAGYRIATDIYPITKEDVTVKIETDSDTRLSGGTEDYGTTHEKTYDQNGLFIFNAEKKNERLTSYGVDVQIIDKTAPKIDLLDQPEMVFYENDSMNAVPYDISMLQYEKGGLHEAYRAEDVFNGKTTSLTEKVTIDWGDFDPIHFKENTFDSSKPYTITYTVYDAARNMTQAKRTVRLIGLYDTLVTVNDALPDFSGVCAVNTDSVRIALKNFSGTAYVRYQMGFKTMGQMKKSGTMMTKNASGEYELTGMSEGWYTFYIQTDKREYFTVYAYVSI